jgi:hypothetical protein
VRHCPQALSPGMDVPVGFSQGHECELLQAASLACQVCSYSQHPPHMQHMPHMTAASTGTCLGQAQQCTSLLQQVLLIPLHQHQHHCTQPHTDYTRTHSHTTRVPPATLHLTEHTTHPHACRLPKASDIIYILQNGTTEQQLAVAAQLQQHAGSGRFARRFTRLGGTTLLASALDQAAATPVDPAVASLLLQALAKLCKTENARRAFVEAGGVPAVLAVLPPTPAEPLAPPRDQDSSFVIVGEGMPAAPATPAADAEAAVVPAAGGRPGADIVAVIEVLRLLLGDAECKEVAVEAGAPGRLAGLLRGSNMALLRAVLGALGSSLDHPLAREAVRCVAGCWREGTCVWCAAAARAGVDCGEMCASCQMCAAVLEPAGMHASWYACTAVPWLCVRWPASKLLAARHTPWRTFHLLSSAYTPARRTPLHS